MSSSTSSYPIKVYTFTMSPGTSYSAGTTLNTYMVHYVWTLPETMKRIFRADYSMSFTASVTGSSSGIAQLKISSGSTASDVSYNSNNVSGVSSGSICAGGARFYSTGSYQSSDSIDGCKMLCIGDISQFCLASYLSTSGSNGIMYSTTFSDISISVTLYYF